jgi:hypothetical protein
VVASARPCHHCLGCRARAVEESKLVLLMPSEARRQRRSGRQSLSPALWNWPVGHGWPSGPSCSDWGQVRVHRPRCTQHFQRRVFKGIWEMIFQKMWKCL